MKSQNQMRVLLVPPVPGTCALCAVNHDPAQPHNRNSLYYQYRFYFQHKRWPTWGDAMAHCEEDVKVLWREALADEGVPEEQLEVPDDDGVDQPQ